MAQDLKEFLIMSVDTDCQLYFTQSHNSTREGGLTFPPLVYS